MDSAHDALSEGVIDAAEWFDSFFDTENFFAESNQTNVRVIGGVFAEQGEDLDFDFKLKGKIHLPRAKKRANLVFGSEPDVDDLDDPGAQIPGEDRFEDATDPAIGLQYFFRESKKKNLSVTAGVRFSGGVPKSVFVGPRYRLLVNLDPWLMRFTQRVRWDTDRGWDSLSRFDFDRQIADLLLRVTPQLEWREDKDGFFYDLRLRLFQRLGKSSAMIYEQNNFFQSEPRHMHEKSDLRVRFRKQWFRKWLFYEIAPRVTFREADDYDPTLGIELNMEVLFGSKGYWADRGTSQRDFPETVPEDRDDDS